PRPAALAALGAGTAVFVLSFVANYYVAIVPLLAERWTIESWREHFAPFPPSHLVDFLWYLRAFEDLLISARSGVSVGLIMVALFIIGLLRLVRACPWMAVMLVFPMLLALLASVMRRFGFADRQILFLQPAVVFLIAQGIDQVLDRLSPRWPRLYSVA